MGEDAKTQLDRRLRLDVGDSYASQGAMEAASKEIANLRAAVAGHIADAAALRAQITALTAERDEMEARAHRYWVLNNNLAPRAVAAEARASELAAALKPFGAYCTWAERQEWPKVVADDPSTPVLGREDYDNGQMHTVTVGDFQRARALSNDAPEEAAQSQPPAPETPAPQEVRDER